MDFDSLPEDPAPPARAPVIDSASNGKIPVNNAISGSGSPAGQSFDSLPDDSESFGTPVQQGIAGLEGASQGLLGPVAPWVETSLMGVPAENIRARQEQNPWTHGIGEAVGLVAPAIATFGASAAARAGIFGAEAAVTTLNATKFMTLPGMMGAAGEGAVQLAKGVSLGDAALGKISQAAIRGAMEISMYGASDAVTKSFIQDPNQSIESLAGAVTLNGVLSGALVGGFLGGAGGAIGQGLEKAGTWLGSKFISDSSKAAIEAGDLGTIADNTPGMAQGFREQLAEALRVPSPDSEEVYAAAKRLGDAPVLEEMVNDHPMVKKMADSLIHGDVSFPALARQAKYIEAGQKVQNALDQVMGPEIPMSKIEAGHLLQDGILAKIEARIRPISDLYEQIVKPVFGNIPIEEREWYNMDSGLRDLKSSYIGQKSPEIGMLTDFIDDFKNVKTANDLKEFKTYINDRLGPMDSKGSRKMVANLNDIFSNFEEETVLKHAQMVQDPATKATVNDALAARELADQEWAKTSKGLQKLSKMLGRQNIKGPYEALNFVRDLDPEDVVQRLFRKKSTFLDTFAKSFPEEMDVMRQYQKGRVRLSSMTNGELSIPKLFTQIGQKNMEPEVKAMLFTPAERQTLADVQRYTRSWPQNFNPSGTSGMTALRAFFFSPKLALAANLRDAAMLGLIKMAATTPETKIASKIGKGILTSEKLMRQAAEGIFDTEKGTAFKNALKAISPGDQEERDELEKHLNEVQTDPQGTVEKLAYGGVIPEVGFGMSQMVARAHQYLDGLKPKPQKSGFFNTETKPNQWEKMSYNRAMDLVNQPLGVIPHIKNGTLLPSDVAAIKTVYPSLYNGISQKLTEAMIDHTEGGGQVPYKVRQSLSLFLGHALDSSLTPQSIQAAQAVFQKVNAGQSGQSEAKTSQKGMAKLEKAPQQLQTTDQARVARQVKA